MYTVNRSKTSLQWHTVDVGIIESSTDPPTHRRTTGQPGRWCVW